MKKDQKTYYVHVKTTNNKSDVNFAEVIIKVDVTTNSKNPCAAPSSAEKKATVIAKEYFKLNNIECSRTYKSIVSSPIKGIVLIEN